MVRAGSRVRIPEAALKERSIIIYGKKGSAGLNRPGLLSLQIAKLYQSEKQNQRAGKVKPVQVLPALPQAHGTPRNIKIKIM